MARQLRVRSCGCIARRDADAVRSGDDEAKCVWSSPSVESYVLNVTEESHCDETRPCAFPETGKPEPKPMPVRGLRASAWGRKFGCSVSETAQGQV
jgi:hypothetical protein